MLKRVRLSSPSLILSSKAFKDFHLSVSSHLFLRCFPHTPHQDPSPSRHHYLPNTSSLALFSLSFLSIVFSSSPPAPRLPCNLDLIKSGACLSIAVIFTEPFFSLCKFGLSASFLPHLSLPAPCFPAPCPNPVPLSPPSVPLTPPQPPSSTP